MRKSSKELKDVEKSGLGAIFRVEGMINLLGENMESLSPPDNSFTKDH
jgi:hypothetical protein